MTVARRPGESIMPGQGRPEMSADLPPLVSGLEEIRLREMYAPVLLPQCRIILPPGWLGIVDAMLRTVADYVDAAPPVRRPLMVTRLEERDGVLQVTHDGGDETVRGMFWMAEALSARVCANTGAAGRLCRRNGVLRVLSDAESRRLGFRHVGR